MLKTIKHSNSSMVHFHLTFDIFVCIFIHEPLFIEHYWKQHKEDEQVVFKQQQPPKDELFYYEQEALEQLIWKDEDERESRLKTTC